MRITARKTVVAVRYINGLSFFQSLFENLGSVPITRRKGDQKRSIHVVCKHFDPLSNAVSGTETGFTNWLS
jgi:hypothetical protein